MARVYFYKLVADNGGAPCVQKGLLSLAICKPMIRTTAEPGDLIFGFAADRLHPDNPLIYVARVTGKARGGEYFKARPFMSREDCVYEWRDGRFVWRRGSLHHGPEHLSHDLGAPPEYDRANVLLSSDFRYMGSSASADYKQHYPAIKEAVENLGRGHRVHHDEPLRLALEALKRQLWKQVRRKVSGRPHSTSGRGVCHRVASCGWVDD